MRGTQVPAGPTATPTATPTVVPSPTPLPNVPQLQNLDTRPRPLGTTPRPVTGGSDAQITMDRPLPNDAGHTVLYDVAAKTGMNLGEGGLGSFSPNSRLFTWASGPWGRTGPDNEVFVIDVITKRRWSLGIGFNPGFIDDTHVRLRRCATCNDTISVDINSLAESSYQFPFETDFPEDIKVGGGTVRFMGKAGTQGSAAGSTYAFFDAGGSPRLQFTVSNVWAAGPNQVLVATLPEDEEVNLYLVSLPQGTVRFVSSVAPVIWGGAYFPVSITDKAIAWTDGFCGFKRTPSVAVYERSTQAIARFDLAGSVKLTPQGYLALGSFGAQWLVDPASGRYVVELPVASNTTWSPNYMYASTGQYGGHGGPCP
jgi:hypothetical protein